MATAPSLSLTEDEKAKILKNLDKYSARFDEEDAMEADAATRELITKRRTQISEWYAFREQMISKLKSEGLVPEEDKFKEIEKDQSQKITATEGEEKDGKRLLRRFTRRSLNKLRKLFNRYGFRLL